MLYYHLNFYYFALHKQQKNYVCQQQNFKNNAEAKIKNIKSDTFV
jgi:hypothetical protein